MNRNWIQSAVMGFVCGLCEPMPLSAQAHRGLLRSFFGIESEGALFLLLSHAAVLVVMLMTAKTELGRLRRTNKLIKAAPRRRNVQPDLNSVNTIKLLRGAGLLAVVGRMLSVNLDFVADRMYLLPLFLTASGILLWLPTQMRLGNKDARNMAPADGMLMGLGAALSAIPGISLVGASASIGAARGVERRYALRFSWLLLIVSLCCSIVIDVLAVVGGGFELELTGLLCAAIGAVFAAIGAYLAVKLMHALVRSGGIGGFCYYNWGQALLCFVLFLLV